MQFSCGYRADDYANLADLKRADGCNSVISLGAGSPHQFSYLFSGFIFDADRGSGRSGPADEPHQGKNMALSLLSIGSLACV